MFLRTKHHWATANFRSYMLTWVPTNSELMQNARHMHILFGSVYFFKFVLHIYYFQISRVSFWLRCDRMYKRLNVRKDTGVPQLSLPSAVWCPDNSPSVPAIKVDDIAIATAISWPVSSFLHFLTASDGWRSIHSKISVKICPHQRTISVH